MPGMCGMERAGRHCCAASACLQTTTQPLPDCCLTPVVAPTGGAKAKTHTLQDSADGFTAFLLVACLPAGTYVATHWAVLFQWVHFWSVLLLASGPLVFVCSLKGGR